MSVLSFENDDDRTWRTWYFTSYLEIKDYNFINDGQNFFNKPVKNIRAYDNILKIKIAQGDDYTIVCLLHCHYFKKDNKIETDLSKQQALDADPKAIQQINITGNLEWAEPTTILFIIEETKETILNFSQGTSRVL